jgi:hypothetical protein
LLKALNLTKWLTLGGPARYEHPRYTFCFYLILIFDSSSSYRNNSFNGFNFLQNKKKHKILMARIISLINSKVFPHKHWKKIYKKKTLFYLIYDIFIQMIEQKIKRKKKE